MSEDTHLRPEHASPEATSAAARIADLEARVRQQDDERALLEQRLAEALTDSVTGLRRREGLYIALDNELSAILGAETRSALEQAVDGTAAVSVLGGMDANALASAPCSVLMGDVSYLSLMNAKGHDAGDALLGALGDVARAMGSPSVESELPGRTTARSEATFYRHGGDEMSAFIRAPRERADAIAEEYRLKVGLKEFEALTRSGLKTNIDVAVAHVSEGVEGLRRLLEGGVVVPPGERAQKIIDLTVAIADMRQSIRKGVDRVRALMRLRRTEQPEEYTRLVSHMRKGAYGIDDATIDALIAKEDAGVALDDAIRTHILERVDATFRDAQRGREREFTVVKTLAAPSVTP
ncbi:hypothetical protein HY480_01265 [Candidatus Uhrbacteria bacterium]|nr:hypothetical protein [Candidatus Uhrbacteria bacterium]